MSPTAKYMGQIDTFSDTGCHVLRPQYGTISGRLHIKTIFSFRTGVDTQFIRNALCSSDNCHATHSHFALCS
jgi:hypothetical protein